MKKICLLTFLLSGIIHCYCQIDVDSLRINSERNDSTEIVVYTTLPSCYLVDSINYTDKSDTMIVSFYYSEEFPQCDCSPCQRQDFFRIKRNIFNELIFLAIIRDCIDNCTSYSEYLLYAKGSLSLGGFNAINNNRKGNVIIFPNPVGDKLFITNIDSDNSKAQIYNIYGNSLIEKTVGSSEFIDISYLPKGLYLLRINDNSVYKLIKN